MKSTADRLRTVLLDDGLSVLKTDTIYGVCANALSPVAVAKLHELRERDDAQGFIVLLPSLDWLDKMIKLDPERRQRLRQIWRSGVATSVILSVEPNSKFAYLADRRDAKTGPTICFRLPQDPVFRSLLQEINVPICAPSANSHGLPPAKNIAAAKAYFGDKVALYLDDGEVADVQPSRIIKFVRKTDLDDPDKFSGEWRVIEVRGDGRMHPEDFIMTRKRKLYKFAKFLDDKRCFDLSHWRDFYQHAFTDVAGSRPVVVELGAGSALFLTELATRHPDQIYLALDRKSDRLYQGAQLAAKRDLKNIFYIWAETAKLNQLLTQNSVHELWLTFPDPFANDNYQARRAELTDFYHANLRFADDKNYAQNLAIYQRQLQEFTRLTRSHSVEFLQQNGRRRLTDKRFLKLYDRLLTEYGQINLKTDDSPLFEWSLNQLARDNWTAEFISRDLRHEQSAMLSDAQIMTSYETRFSAELWPINFAKLLRNQPSIVPAPSATTKDF